MSDQIFWYITRSAALVSWLGAALSIAVGLATSSRILGRKPTIPWLVDLHRGLAGLSVTFLAVHMVSLFLDGFAKLSVIDLLVPWVATVPGLTRSSIAYGVIAFWLIAIVQTSSLFRDRIDEDVWRTLHLTSFASLGFGTLHAIQTGSDVDNPLIVAIGVSTLAAIALAGLTRLARLPAKLNMGNRRQRAGLGAAAGRDGPYSGPADSKPGAELFAGRKDDLR